MFVGSGLLGGRSEVVAGRFRHPHPDWLRDNYFHPEVESTWWERVEQLVALRRSGAPYRLSPTELFSTLMVTSGTMTHRLKRLEASGWIERVPNALDARSMLVQLTKRGFKLIDEAVTAHVEKERALLQPLPAASLAALNTHLSALLAVLEGGAGSAEEAQGD